MNLYVQSTRPGKEDLRFKVLSFDPETKEGVLIGSCNVKFKANLDKEALQKDGYTVVKGD